MCPDNSKHRNAPRKTRFRVSSVQLLSHVQHFVTPWTAACQASLSITTPRVYSNSSPLHQWFHLTISSSVVPFSSCLQSFPASGKELVLHISFSFSISSVQSLSRVRLFVTPWTAAHQASLSITNSQSLLKLMSVIPSNHLILCGPRLLLLSIFPNIRVFSNESTLCIR